MINHAATIVKTAFSIPFTVIREARKVVEAALGNGGTTIPSDDRANERKAESHATTARAEQEKAEIQAGIRDQARASIETVKVGEEIREHNVTADNVPL
ncbi:MAG TPA: hypothetical protein VNB24_06455 [Acidimicrobiales bacterium]|nr:hypothetical protein [Acidimicrobiales bacterium]